MIGTQRVCHTDVGYLDGTLTDILGFTPITLGHEIAGVVSQLGEDVTGFEIGQKVVIPASVPGPGTGTDGGFAARGMAGKSAQFLELGSSVYVDEDTYTAAAP